jgi:hypothetical protein
MTVSHVREYAAQMDTPREVAICDLSRVVCPEVN